MRANLPFAEVTAEKAAHELSPLQLKYQKTKDLNNSNTNKWRTHGSTKRSHHVFAIVYINTKCRCSEVLNDVRNHRHGGRVHIRSYGRDHRLRHRHDDDRNRHHSLRNRLHR